MSRLPEYAECRTCQAAVIVTGTTCPWCSNPVTTADTLRDTTTHATSYTLLQHLNETKEPA